LNQIINAIRNYYDEKNVKRISQAIIFFLLTISVGNTILQNSGGGGSLGAIVRSSFPAILYLILLIIVNKLDFSNIALLFERPKVDLKLIIFSFVLACPLLILLTSNANINIVDSTILLTVLFGIFLTLYFFLTGRSSYGVALTLLILPFLNYLEHVTFFKWIEWGPLVLSPSILFLFVLFFVSIIRISADKNIQITSPALKILFVLIVIALVASLFSINPIVSIRMLIVSFICPLMFLIIVLRNIQSEEDLKILLSSIIAFVCLIGFLNLYFLLRYPGAGLIQTILSPNLSSNVGGGVWGSISLMALPLAFVQFIILKKKWKVFSLLAIGLLLLGIVFSYARIALLGFPFALVVLLKERKARKLTFFFLITLILFSVLYSSFLKEVVLFRFQHVHSVTDFIFDLSVQARWEGAKAALRMIKDYPFGIGAGMWSGYVHSYAKMPRIFPWGWGYIVDPHNIYLEVAVNYGIQGFLVYMLFLGMIFRESLFLLYKPKNEFRHYLMMGLFSSFICFLALSFAGSNTGQLLTLGSHFMFILFWLIVAMIIKLAGFERGLCN
jgi:O-antigen ligase